MKKQLVKSILRYPGGKSRAVDYIFKLIPEGTKELVAPFFGGGSVELACASHGIKVYGYDVFSPLVSFWQEAIKDPKALSEEVQKYHPLSKEDFYSLQKEQMTIDDSFKAGALFYVLNRSSFSGSTLSGGMSPAHPRFNQESIDRLKNFKINNLEVEKLSFEESLKLHPNALVYADPPYWIKNTLYGNRGDTHKGFDHLGLAKNLEKRKLWILSYNNSPEVRELYKDHVQLFPEWKYGMSTDKNSKEIIILSKDLASLLKLK